MTVYWPNGSLSIPRVSSEYDSARLNPVTGIVQPHNGIDLVGWTDNCSPVDGTVVFAGYNGGAGNEVRIRADGPTAFHVGDYYRILHNAYFYVSTGQRVSARQPVGRMGTTGQSTGVHCHFETHEGGLWRYVNPRDYMARANAGSAAGGGGTPFPEKPKEWDEMASRDEVKAAAAEAMREVIGEKMVAPVVSIVPLTDGGIYLFSTLTGRRAHIQSPYHVQIIQRAVDNNSNDQMLHGELDIVAGYLTAVNPPVGATVDTEALAARLAEIDASDDAETVKKAVRDALAETVGEIRFPV